MRTNLFFFSSPFVQMFVFVVKAVFSEVMEE